MSGLKVTQQSDSLSSRRGEESLQKFLSGKYSENHNDVTMNFLVSFFCLSVRGLQKRGAC